MLWRPLQNLTHNLTWGATLALTTAVVGCGRTEQTTNLRSESGRSADQTPFDPSNIAPVVSPQVKADLKVNGEDGPVYVKAGAEVEITWTSSAAAFCTGINGYLLNGSRKLTVTEPITLTLQCMNGESDAVDFVSIEIGTKPPVDVKYDEISRINGLSYCKATPMTYLRLDLARPKSETPALPALVFVHGDDGASPTRSNFSGMIEEAAKRGYVAVTIDYRSAEYSADQVVDVRCAVRWLRTNADTYGIDKTRIGLLGASSGGHLALMAALADEGAFSSAEFAGESSRVQAVVNWYGPTDLASLYPLLPADQQMAMALALGGPPATRQAAYQALSPVSLLSADDPPLWTSHGTNDSDVPHSQAETLDTRAKAAGVAHTLELLEGQAHGFTGAGATQAAASAFAFFAAKLTP